MKRLFFLMAVSVIASSILSCTKTPVQPEVPGDPEVEVVPEVFTVKAYHADDASTPMTRTSLVPYDSGNKQILRIQWAPHEEINFFDCVKKGGYRFQSTNQDYAYQVDFQKVGDPYVEQTDACYRAIYPYNKKNSVGMEGDDKNTFRAWIPAEQVGVPDTFADGMNVAIASSMTPEMAFRNICGGFKFTLANDDIAEVRLSGLEEEQLAGDVAVLYIPYDDETGFDMYFIGAGKDAQCISTLRMVPAEGAAFLPGREYYFVMMPATLTGFQFEFIKTNGSTGKRTVTFNDWVTMKRNVFQWASAPIDTGVKFDEVDEVPLEVQALLQAYPDQVIGYEDGKLLLANGERIAFDDREEGAQDDYLHRLNTPTVKEMFYDVYPLGELTVPPYLFDPGRYRNVDLLAAMYGHTENEVASKTVKVDVFGTKIEFTSVNGAADCLRAVIKDIGENHPDMKKYFVDPSSFVWKEIQGTNRLSMHCFAGAIDIGVKYSNYWLWSNPNASDTDRITYKNSFPEEVVHVFEKYGFISGTRWYHYDTMHFEYRPEIIIYSKMVNGE